MAPLLRSQQKIVAQSWTGVRSIERNRGSRAVLRQPVGGSRHAAPQSALTHCHDAEATPAGTIAGGDPQRLLRRVPIETTRGTVRIREKRTASGLVIGGRAVGIQPQYLAV